MKRQREIPFAFDEASFTQAINDFRASAQQQSGTLIDIYKGTANGYPVGIILIEEDV